MAVKLERERKRERDRERETDRDRQTDRQTESSVFSNHLLFRSSPSNDLPLPNSADENISSVKWFLYVVSVVSCNCNSGLIKTTIYCTLAQGNRWRGRLGCSCWGCPITSSTADEQFGRASLLNTAERPQFLPSVCTMPTRLMNLGHQSVHSSTHHWIHIPQIHWDCILGQKSAARHQRWCALKSCRPIKWNGMEHLLSDTGLCCIPLVLWLCQSGAGKGIRPAK